MIQNSAAQIVRLSNVRAWFRGLLKNSIHSATGSVLVTLGTNGLDGTVPGFEGVGLDWRQMGAVFTATLVIGALRYVNEVTKPGTTSDPFPMPRKPL